MGLIIGERKKKGGKPKGCNLLLLLRVCCGACEEEGKGFQGPL